MIRILKKIYNALILIKLDLRAIFTSLFGLPRYFRDWKSFSRLLRNKQEWPMSIYPILLDRNAESASLGEYFWQDLLVAKEIIKQSPDRHIDVGSRVDAIMFEFGGCNIDSRTFFKDFWSLLVYQYQFSLYRLLPKQRLQYLSKYSETLEQFNYQNILACAPNIEPKWKVLY